MSDFSIAAQDWPCKSGQSRLGKPISLGKYRVSPESDAHSKPLALLWQNVFAPLFFGDLLSAIWALLRRRPKDEINDGVT
ncbi:hypothetical protein, partial [Bradyrhizobium elkanii]|uniref:hypothetical protein n=1 Tax=Bradyrhizobium elkanii TaxID=29448 RepID=UPI001FCBC4DD